VETVYVLQSLYTSNDLNSHATHRIEGRDWANIIVNGRRNLLRLIQPLRPNNKWMKYWLMGSSCLEKTG